MKSHLFQTVCIVTTILFPTILLDAQESAKPIYKIEVKREGASFGSFNVELFPLIAPKAVAYFDSLVAIKFYDSTAFHRVVPGFVIQGGDPNSKHLPRDTWGNGDPNQTNVPAEFSNVAYLRGILGAARDTDPNSANSQFFICVANATSLNGNYTAYGKVISGMDIVDNIVASPRDANDNPLIKIEMFVTKIGTNDSVPQMPIVLFPADGANRISTDSALAWTEVSDAMLYHLQIATDSMFAEIVYDKEIGTSFHTLTAIKLGLVKYYWRVSANNGGHRSPYTSVRSFTTGLAIPKLSSPSNFSSSQPTNVPLRWNSVPQAASYRVQVATTLQFTQESIVFEQSGITDTAKQMSGLQASKKHYWHVAAETPAYTGITYSGTWNFTTGTTADVEGGIDAVPLRYALNQNYPNPFNPSTVISFVIASDEFVSLKIYDAMGRKVETVVEEVKSAGEHSEQFNADRLSSGIYFYTLSAGQFQETRRMVIMK
ncbi:MAG: peptidylprolyl isomerase [Bacteroidota bacterium]